MKENNKGIVVFIVLALLLTAALLLTSCRTMYVDRPVTHIERDTVKVIKESHDTVHVEKEKIVRDSTVITDRDSIRIVERWHWERDYRYEKVLQNTIDSLRAVKVKADSISYPVYVDKVVYRTRNSIKFLAWLGVMTIIILIGVMVMRFLLKIRI